MHTIYRIYLYIDLFCQLQEILLCFAAGNITAEQREELREAHSLYRQPSSNINLIQSDTETIRPSGALEHASVPDTP